MGGSAGEIGRRATCVPQWFRRAMICRMATARASWGSVRKLPSGRYQARYRVDGKMAGAPTTFRTKRDAEAYLSTVRADMERGTWVNPTAGKVTLREYRPVVGAAAGPAATDRRAVRERAATPHPPGARRRRAGEAHAGQGARLALGPAQGRKARAPTVAKCYRLVHAILNTAVADELLVRNPCVIKGAGQEKAPERPIASIPQVFEIADTIEPRFRAMVLVGAFVGLRLGEMLALTRERIDLLHGRIKVVEQYQELKDGTHMLGPPKSDAGIRTVAIPAMLKPELEAHLATFAAPGKKGLVFCGPERAAAAPGELVHRPGAGRWPSSASRG